MHSALAFRPEFFKARVGEERPSRVYEAATTRYAAERSIVRFQIPWLLGPSEPVADTEIKSFSNRTEVIASKKGENPRPAAQSVFFMTRVGPGASGGKMSTRSPVPSSATTFACVTRYERTRHFSTRWVSQK